MENMLESKTTIDLPTSNGKLKFYHHDYHGQDCLVAFSDIDCDVPFLRIHSSCVFSESFGTQDCDCARQLQAAVQYVENNGGIIIYLYQEGRGIGLRNKIKAINLEQEQGLNTEEAFKCLGYESSDPRDYGAVLDILKDMKISEVTLGTHNPKKVEFLKNAGIVIKERIELPIETNPEIERYLKSKKEHLDHL